MKTYTEKEYKELEQKYNEAIAIIDIQKKLLSMGGDLMSMEHALVEVLVKKTNEED